MSSIYLFVDGRHLQKHYAASVRQWFGNDGEINFHRIKEDYAVSTMFYYDCLHDRQRTGESEADFKARVEAQEKYFDNIPRIIRLGSSSGKSGSDKRLRQKKVDVLLAVDMMKHAVRQNMYRAILIAGDLDFEPLVETLVDLGIYVELRGDPQHTARYLIRAASEYQPLTFRDYYNWSAPSLKTKYPIPGLQSGAYNPGYPLTRRGSLAGHPCELYESDQGVLLTVPQFENDSFTLVETDLDRLKRFCILQYGPLDGI